MKGTGKGSMSGRFDLGSLAVVAAAVGAAEPSQ